MSLMLRQAGSLKPEIRLAQAVSEFEATLTPEQKSSFQASRARAVSTAPTMSDVMRLTAEIDLKSTNKQGHGRCFGPRMTNTLQAIQQFAALGDIIVGGGQNLIACGVWAAARMALQVITGYFTYLENLSLLFMAIGRNAPRYQTMAALYPKSKSLQGYLCEYFIVITKVCHQSVMWTRKSALARFSTTISDPQMKTFKDELDLWSSAIKEEANVLLNQAVAEEAKHNSLFRSVATARSNASAHRHKIERQTQFLDACSQYDYCTAWKQTRKRGTTKLLTCCIPYQQWRDNDDDSTSILFLGKLGAGKSVLLANIVDALNLRDLSITLYFFARHDNEESMKAKTILGSLIRQLLDHRKNDSRFSHLFPENIPRIDLEGILDLFNRARPENEDIFIILDGLDECEIEVQSTVLEQLAKLQSFGYRLCLSVRTSERRPIWDSQLFQFHASIPEENPDIRDFVVAEVDTRVKDGRLVIRDPKLVDDVKQELIAGACGMFLWVSLQIDSICAEACDHDIREAIGDLPRDLTETFKRNVLKASSKDYKGYHIRILKILAGAKELLTTEELRQAASVTIGQTIWNSNKEINSIHTVLKFCGSLVMVDEEDETVRFIHHSARSFCIKGSHDVTDWAFSELEADQHIAEILVTYLSYNVFDTQVSRNVVPTIDAKEIPRRVALSTIRSRYLGTSIAGKVLRSTTRLKRDIGPALAKASVGHSEEKNEFPLIRYAKKHWVQHTANLEDFALLPQWYILLDHPSFGINLRHVPAHTKLVLTLFPTPGGLAASMASLNGLNLSHRQFRPSNTMVWAFSHSHIMLLKHQLTKDGGAERIRNYVKLFSLLRRVALRIPSILQYDLDYNFVRWLSPMLLNLGMDHPAKEYCLGRIHTSDDRYMELARTAVKQADWVAILALVRDDYTYQDDLSLLEWDSHNGLTHHCAMVPPILKAGLLSPSQQGKVLSVISSNDLWLLDLISWFLKMKPTYFQWGRTYDAPLSFSRAFDALNGAGVGDKEINLLKDVLTITRNRSIKAGYADTTEFPFGVKVSYQPALNEGWV